MELNPPDANFPASFTASVFQMWSRIDQSDLPNLDYEQALVIQRCRGHANSILLADIGNWQQNH